MKVWVVSNNLSPDVPRGVVGVFTNKKAACKEATYWMRSNGGRYDRKEWPGIVSYTDEAVEFGMAVYRFEVRKEPVPPSEVLTG